MTTEQTRARVADLDELLRDDRNVGAVVKRAGFPSIAAADIACRRCGRTDLARLLRFYGGRADRPKVDPYAETSVEFYLEVDGDPWRGIVPTSLHRGTRWHGGHSADSYGGADH